MMKKTIKKLLAALLAVAMVCAMAIPAFAYNPGETEENLNGTHGYSAFQIFKGVISKDNPTLSGVDWGQNITEPDIFLANLKNDPTIGEKFETAATAQEVLAVISQWSNSDDNSIAFARVVCSYLYPNADAKPEPVITDHTGGINIPKSGYYLIVDTTYFNPGDYYHAYNSFFLLNVPQVPYVVPINRKVVKPTVEKEVYDNQDGANEAGFGSSADHAINEEFQFKLTATLPANPDRAYDYYDEYMVTFCDTLSAGITFDRWDTVVINNGGADIPIPAENYYSDASNQDLTLSIEDVKTCAPGLNLNNGATITVTYTAHLNEKAYVNTAGGASNTENKNSVYLIYSNNPRSSAFFDRTPESAVCVYTYQLNNTKYHDDDTQGNELEGAGFKLYSDADCKNEVELYQDGEFYYPIKDATGKKAVEMISGENGQFNVKGLDAGTYYLKETITPAGYDTCGVTPVTIKADHSGNDHVNLEGSNLTIVNKKAGGITLPSTGGIGTTIFYVVGGGLMVAAIVLLVTKKRMENK
mgnify:CR=1 FL=1